MTTIILCLVCLLAGAGITYLVLQSKTVKAAAVKGGTGLAGLAGAAWCSFITVW
jgi:hypothetical protein